MYNKLENTKNQKEINSIMSIVIMGAKNDELFCVSDSRSTNVSDHTVDDNWKKVMKIEKRNMILAVSGENSICGRNILDLIEQLQFYDDNEQKTNYDFLKYVTRYLIHKKSGAGIINLFAGYFDKGIATIKVFDIFPAEITEKTFGNNQIAYSGSDYSNCLLNKFDCSKYSNAKQAVSYFSYYIEEMINLNEFLLDSPIGGYFQYQTAVLPKTEQKEIFPDLFLT